MASAGLCPYCGDPLDARPTHAEHPLARALGGAFVIEAHLDCGDRLNREVDEPLLHCMPVVKMRSDYAIPDRYGKPPKPFSLVGTDVSGARSTLRLLPLARVDFRHHPHEEVAEDGTITVRFDHAEDKEVIERKMASARRRNPNAHGVLQSGARRGGYRVSGIRIPTQAWPRLAAKVGLAVGALVAEPEWLQGETASHLREVLWSKPSDQTYLTLDMAPGELPEDHAVRGALLPPEHLIWTSHSRDGRASVCLYLFAEWFLPVPVALSPVEGRLVRDYAWLVEPRRAKVTREGPLDEVRRALERRRPRVESARRAHAAWLERMEPEAKLLRARSACS